MAYSNTMQTTGYKLLPAQQRTIQPIDTQAAIEHIYTVFAVSFAILLICLAVRILFALLIVQGPLSQAINTITAPVIAPFSDVFHDSNTMVQISTMTAFTTYYLIYGVTSRYLAVFRRRLAA